MFELLAGLETRSEAWSSIGTPCSSFELMYIGSGSPKTKVISDSSTIVCMGKSFIISRVISITISRGLVSVSKFESFKE